MERAESAIVPCYILTAYYLTIITVETRTSALQIPLHCAFAILLRSGVATLWRNSA